MLMTTVARESPESYVLPTILWNFATAAIKYVHECMQRYYCLRSNYFLRFHCITREMFLSILSSRRAIACHYIRNLVAQCIEKWSSSANQLQIPSRWCTFSVGGGDHAPSSKVKLPPADNKFLINSYYIQTQGRAWVTPIWWMLIPRRATRECVSTFKGRSSFLIAEISACCNYFKVARQDHPLRETENKLLRSIQNGFREAKLNFRSRRRRETRGRVNMALVTLLYHIRRITRNTCGRRNAWNLSLRPSLFVRATEWRGT